LLRALGILIALALLPVVSLAHVPHDFRPGEITVMPDGSAWIALERDFSIVHLGRDGCYERLAVPVLKPQDPWIFPSIRGLAIGDRFFVLLFSNPGSIDAYGGNPGWWSVLRPASGHYPFQVLADGYGAWYLERAGLEHLAGDTIDRTIPIPMTGPYEPRMAQGLKSTIWVTDATTLFEVDTATGRVVAFKPEAGRTVGAPFVTKDGSVWFRSGNTLGHFGTGGFSFEPSPMPMPDVTTAFDVAPDGVVRFAHEKRLYRYDRGGIHVMAHDREIDAIAGTADGSAWIALDYPAAMEYLDRDGKATIFDLYALQQASSGDHPPRRCPR